MKRLLAMLAVLLLVMGACGGDDDGDDAATGAGDETETTVEPEAEAATELEVETVDFGFKYETDTKLAAGVVTIDQKNTGKEDHQVQLFKLNSGKTFDDFKTASKSGKEADVAAMSVPAGGPIAGVAGQQAASVELSEGTYAFICFIPSPSDGTPHAAKGMIAGPVTVEKTDDAETFSGSPALTVTGKEYAYSDIKSFAGKGSVQFENGGKEPHEAALIALAPGKTVADIGKFFSGPPAGPPPFTVTGGVAVIPPGAKSRFDVDLKAGNYVFLCFVAAADGSPHFAKGMAGAFTVA